MRRHWVGSRCRTPQGTCRACTLRSCGDEATGWTAERSFVAAPNATAQQTTRVPPSRTRACSGALAQSHFLRAASRFVRSRLMPAQAGPRPCTPPPCVPGRCRSQCSATWGTCRSGTRSRWAPTLAKWERGSPAARLSGTVRPAETRSGSQSTPWMRQAAERQAGIHGRCALCFCSIAGTTTTTARSRRATRHSRRRPASHCHAIGGIALHWLRCDAMRCV